MGFQAEGAAPIVRGHAIKEPQTIASAIRIGNPASWQRAVAARDESGGIIDMVSDAELIEVTPKSIRLRKQLLTQDQRSKARHATNKELQQNGNSDT